ncbi:ral GTPase-activating protein subunit alpha-1-like isoform X2 [Sycon ciliatum]|uniref:ral GTPase-activating protein subunit alpha-1-like isoform X2 n=1 Tax=Sycon ciliatum TaxID=27933 RepID=UPI0031F65F36
MFHRKPAQDATKASVDKFRNPQNTLPKRLKHLAIAIKGNLEKQNDQATKEFFSQNYYQVFQVFHDAFTAETTGKGGKVGHPRGGREELFEVILPILETILVFTPELLFQKWQCNSIGTILCKLLHPQNQLRIRKLGLQFLLLWLQSLRDNITPFAENLLATAVPEFPPKSSKPDEDASADRSAVSWVNGPEYNVPILPINADGPRPIEDPTMEMMECLLECLTSQVHRLVWDGSKKQCGFDVLFHLFKKHYLFVLFPSAQKHRGPYTERIVFDTEASSLNFEFDVSGPVYDRVRERIINWLVQWISPNRASLSIGVPTIASTQSSTSLASTSASNISESGKEQSSWWVTKEHEDQVQNDIAMLCSTVYGSQENVILLHEMLRKTFRLPFIYLSTMEMVILLIQDWLALDVSKRPEFMQERVRPTHMLVKRHSEPQLFSPPGEETATMSPPTSPTSPMSPTEPKAMSRRRFTTYAHKGEHPVSSDVRVGLQANLRLFITEAAIVFLAEPEHQTLHEQVEACGQVIRLYQTVAMKSLMDRDTWAHLLSTLLQITKHVLGTSKPPSVESNTMPQQLAMRVGSDLVKTVFVLWMNASLSVSVATSLWDDVLRLLTSLTHWPAVVEQWKHIMKMMTRLLGQYVYGICLSQSSKAHTRANRPGRRPGTGNSPLDGTPGGGATATKSGRGGSGGGGGGGGGGTRTGSGPHPRVLGHTRDHSISSSLEQFKGDPIVAKPATASMPALEEASESGGGGGGGGDIRSHTGSLTPSTTTTASLRAARANARRLHGSEPDALKGGDNMPKLIGGMKAPSVDLSSPLRDGDSLNKVPIDDDLDEEPEGMEHVESAVSVQEYSIDDSPDKDKDRITIGSSSEDGLSTSCGSGSEIGDSDSTTDKIHHQYSSSAEDAQFGMAEKLLQEGDDKSPMDESPTSEEGNATESGSATPVVKDSDFDDDLPPVRRGRANTMNSLEAKQLFSGGSTSTTGPIDEDEESRHLEVLAGGSRRGWTPASAAVLWRRSLGILGDPNRIPDPMLHAKAISSLAEFWEDLLRIRNRDGEPVESEALREETANYEPPLLVFASWVFEACVLGPKFKEGQLRAYQLLCRMLLERYDRPLPVDFLSHAYRLLHTALKSQDKDLMDCVIWNASTIFAVDLPGVTVLMLDFLTAAEKILTSNDSARPRREALTVLGSLLHYAYAFPQMTVQPMECTEEVPTLEGLKDKLMQMLLHTTKKEPFRQSRCLALSMLGLFVYSEYLHVSRHRLLIIECINVLLLSIRFPDHSIASTALDTILLLTDVKQMMPEQLPLKIVEILCTTIPVIINEKSMNEADAQKICIRILFCLLDWVMTIPTEKLNTFKFEGLPDVSLMQSVFLVLGNLVQGEPAPRRTESGGSQSKLSVNSEQQNSNNSLREAADGKPGSSVNVAKLSITEAVAPAVKVAASTVISHLANMLGHFPFSGGAASFGSSVLESHDVTDSPDLNKELFESPCVQFFSLGNTSLLSLIELPAATETQHSDGGGKVVQGSTVARVIVRDVAGKWCWDSSYLHGPVPPHDAPIPGVSKTGLREADDSRSTDRGQSLSQLSHQQAMSVRDSLIPGSIAARTVAAINGLDGKDNLAVIADLPSSDSFSAVDGDVLEELLHYITTSSPEVRASDDRPLDFPVQADQMYGDTVEEYMVDVIETEHSSEQTYLTTTVHGMDASPIEPCEMMPTPAPFQTCRCLLTQLGFLNLDSEKRRQFNLLQKTDQLLRELRNLDSRHCRETHKIGIVYVHHGQQDKESILSNTAGSAAFETFLAAMTWEVDLQQHPGFKGGLKPGTTRTTAPYYCSSTAEVLFHVATRMENSDERGQLTKLRHIGNDEILIVWSEHSRDWRRDIIRTDFGLVMIVIYPMQNCLYRVQILKKESSRDGKSFPFFGPLFDGAVVDKCTLPGLVRATAINASRARRSELAYYQAYYEERNKYIQSTTKSCRLETTLEEFTSLVVRPGSPPALANTAGKTDRHPSGVTPSGSRDGLRFTSPTPKDELTIPIADEASLSPGLNLPSADARSRGSTSQFSFLEGSATSATLVASASLGDDVLTPSGICSSPPEEGTL